MKILKSFQGFWNTKFMKCNCQTFDCNSSIFSQQVEKMPKQSYINPWKSLKNPHFLRWILRRYYKGLWGKFRLENAYRSPISASIEPSASNWPHAYALAFSRLKICPTVSARSLNFLLIQAREQTITNETGDYFRRAWRSRRGADDARARSEVVT